MATKPELRRAVANSYIKASDYNYNFEQLNNYIENGIADNAINNYEYDREYSKGQWVLANTSNGNGLYESQVDGNKGNSLLDTTYWKKVIIGGDLSRIEEQLANKVDLDAQNLSAEGKSLISGFGMPSIKYIDLTLGASDSTYTAPANGYFLLSKTANASQYVLMVVWSPNNTGSEGDWLINQATMTVIEVGGTVKAKKGDILYVRYTASGNVTRFRFIYAEGEV